MEELNLETSHPCIVAFGIIFFVFFFLTSFFAYIFSLQAGINPITNIAY